MWLVRLALRRPWTIAVSAALVILMGLLSLASMTVDIFPVIDIPVVGVVWSYNGLSAQDMETRVVNISERAMSTTVSGISRIESDSLPGIGNLRVYFEQGTDIGGAIAQISAVMSAITRILPPGMTPPNIVRFNASNVPVAQMTISSDTLPEEKLFDYALQFIRLKLFTIPGLSTPAPYGGKTRQINVDVQPQALYARGMSPQDVVNALQVQNLTLPAGTARIGTHEFNIDINSSPPSIEGFANLPIRASNGAVVTMGDVAKISDAYAPQTNVVRINGKRATFLNILKKANASTIAVVRDARDAIKEILATAPQGLNIKMDFDQSVFVKGAISSVIREALIAAFLVSLMILFFLGDWRSVIVVCTSIPLAIFCSIIALNLTGNSINIMTLGGLSLAIGMLVDDATVAIENIDRHLEMGLPLTAAVLEGAHQIAMPAITATLAICIVFFPVVLLTGPARFLFIPMAISVVFAMLASYLLSRTLVPLLSRMLFEKKHGLAGHKGHEQKPVVKANGRWSRWVARANEWRIWGFDRLQAAYDVTLDTTIGHPRFVLGIFGALVVVSLVLPFMIGMDFFPSTDVGIMKIHFRAPAGVRLEESERLVAQVEDHIRKIVPADELQTINSMIGVPTSYSLAFVPTDNTAAMDSELLVSLKEGHRPTGEYVKKIRTDLNESFPGSTIYFQPADMVSQVLNFGQTSPLDVRVEFPKFDVSYPFARKLRDEMRKIPGTADVSIRQVLDYPALRVNVDRTVAANLGVTQKDVANSMLVSLSSSSMVAPSYFINPTNNVNYQVNVMVPLNRLASVSDLLGTPITPGLGDPMKGMPVGPSVAPRAPAQNLGNLATVSTRTMVNEVTHSTVQRVIDVIASVEGRDLGSVASDIEDAIKKLGELPKGMKIKLHGQNEVMSEAFTKLGLGLVVAILLVYLLMAVLFQSWLDPLIVIAAVPGALVGILWMLLFTGTTINVESFMGSIMAVGIAASNSILVVNFANDLRIDKKLSAFEAAREAGRVRLRPVLMTAIAMILGMLPTALGMGEGGEQNAPLGRAVIGGLLVATTVTLLVVPVIYSVLRKKLPIKAFLDDRVKAEEKGHAFDVEAHLKGAH